MKEGQVWSMDLIVAVIIFLLAVGVFYFFAGTNNNHESSTLQIESKVVADKLGGDGVVSIANGTALDNEKLKLLATMPYDQLKQELGLKNDFCIVLRDQEGNLIPVLVRSQPSPVYKIAIGSPQLNITINGISEPCGAELDQTEIDKLVS